MILFGEFRMFLCYYVNIILFSEFRLFYAITLT